jgi:hypothetical protein
MCEQREYLITPDPAHKEVAPWARVKAVNALDALNKYAIDEGYSNYEDLGDPLRDWMGIDQYGLWGVFTNATIWAIPEARVVLPTTP